MAANSDETNSLDEEVSRRYPYLLASTYYRAFHSTHDLDEAHDYLLDLFEVTLKYLTSIALSQYFKDAPNNPKINRDVGALRRPSLGHWQGWLRDILDLYGRNGRPLAVPELASFYRQKHTDGLLRAYTTLREVMSERMRYAGGKNLGVVTPQQFFELVGEYRNLLAHGVRPSRPDRERVASILAPAMRDIFASMAFIADYRLVYVDEVKRAPGSSKQGRRYDYYYTTLMGDRPRAAPAPRTLERDDTEPEKLYLLAKGGQFDPLASLYPFLTFRYCDSCNTYQAFVLNTSKGDTLDYVSYQCTHHYIQAEFLDLQELLSSVGADADMNTEEPLPEEELVAEMHTQEEAAQQARKEKEYWTQDEARTGRSTRPRPQRKAAPTYEDREAGATGRERPEPKAGSDDVMAGVQPTTMSARRRTVSWFLVVSIILLTVFFAFIMQAYLYRRQPSEGFVFPYAYLFPLLLILAVVLAAVGQPTTMSMSRCVVFWTLIVSIVSLDELSGWSIYSNEFIFVAETRLLVALAAALCATLAWRRIVDFWSILQRWRREF